MTTPTANQNSSVQFCLPPGRMVYGRLATANDKDADGGPLLVKSGPNKGKPRVSYSFGLAIPKNPGETHWAQTEWGAKIWATGCAAFPAQSQGRDFAWKITDGDSQEPNKRGRKPCESEGWAGHWVIRLSAGFMPKAYTLVGVKDATLIAAELVDATIKPGYYIEVYVSVAGNGSPVSPGVYINPSMVCLRAFGAEIMSGPDVADANFGQTSLPAGASLAPPPGAAPYQPPPVPGAAPYQPPPVPGAAPYQPPPGAGQYQPPPVAGAGQYQPPPVPVPVTPNPAFAAGPGGVPVPPARVMLPAAQGATYEQLIQNGWTDVTLRQHGLMA